MKLLTLLAVLLAAPAASACPNLTGSYICVNRAATEMKAQIHFRRQQLTHATRFVLSTEHENIEYVADNLPRYSSEEKFQVKRTSRCSGNSLIVEEEMNETAGRRKIAAIIEFAETSLSTFIMTTRAVQSGAHTYSQINEFDCSRN